MNKFVLYITSCILVFSLCGCENIEPVEEKAIIHCEAVDHALDCFYEDTEYEYCFNDTGNYVTYQEIKYTVKEALEKNMITMNDIEQASIENRQCAYKKRKNNED